MELIKDQDSWTEFRKKLPTRYNIHPSTPVNGSPKEFPCLIETFPTNNVNGFSIRCVFAYRADAERLFERESIRPFVNMRLCEDIYGDECFV